MSYSQFANEKNHNESENNMELLDTPIQLESLAYGGDAVGHIGERVVFVPDGVPGDEVSLEITEDKGSYLKGRIREIVTSSEDRIEPFCPVAGKCGGCQWQHIAYPAQINWKQRIVEQSLKRIGGFATITVEPCVPSVPDREYRSIVRFPAQTLSDNLVWGYYEKNSHDLVAIDSCPVATEKVTAINNHLCRMLRTKPLSGVREIIIQASHNHPSSLISLITSERYDFTPVAEQLLADITGLAGVTIRRAEGSGRSKHVRTYDDPHRFENIAGKDFRIFERSFFQVNIPQTENLITLAGEMTTNEPGNVIVDGYGGVGLFSLSILPPDRTIHLFDSSQTAVKDSIHNAEIQGYKSFSGRCMKAESALLQIRQADVIFLDPPRTGLGRKVIDAAVSLGAGTVIYISCNPATLARDLKQFVDNGYEIERVVPLDMFPHTYHIETIVKMKKKKSSIPGADVSVE